MVLVYLLILLCDCQRAYITSNLSTCFGTLQNSQLEQDEKKVSTNSKLTWILILKKEVIQPQVPLRLPCYDFTPVIAPTVDALLLAVRVTS